MNMMLLTRWVLWVLITPGLLPGIISTKAFVFMKKHFSDEPIAGTHDEEYLGFSVMWAVLFWLVFVRWVV